MERYTVGITTLQWWYGLCVPVTPRAMSAGVLRLLAGTPLPNRSKSRDQTKSDPLVHQVGGWAEG